MVRGWNVKSCFIVAYDISDNKLRNRLFESLKDFGLRPIQESVFWGQLRTAEQNAVKRLLINSCVDTNDRAIMWPVSLSDIRRATLINYPEDTFSLKEYLVC